MRLPDRIQLKLKEVNRIRDADFDEALQNPCQTVTRTRGV